MTSLCCVRVTSLCSVPVMSLLLCPCVVFVLCPYDVFVLRPCDVFPELSNYLVVGSAVIQSVEDLVMFLSFSP